MATLASLVTLLSRRVSDMLAQQYSDEDELLITQSTIDARDYEQDMAGYVFCIMDPDSDSTKTLGLITPEQLEKCKAAFSEKIQEFEDGYFPEIATVSLRLNLDLEGKIDFSQEDKEVMDDRLLKHYSALDFLRLFFLSILS